MSEPGRETLHSNEVNSQELEETALLTPALRLQSCINIIKVVALGGMLIAVSVAAIILLLKSVPFPKPNKPGSEKRDTSQDISSDPDSSMTMEGPDVKLLPVSSIDDDDER